MGLFSGPLQSNNFVSGSTGWQINNNGSAEFNNLIIRRQLEIDSGTISLAGFTPTSSGGGATNSDNWASVGRTHWITITNIPITAWAGSEKTYLATVEHVSGSVNTTTTHANSGDVYWGWTATVLPLTRWQNPQTLRLKIEYVSRHVTFQSAPTIKWKLYEVS